MHVRAWSVLFQHLDFCGADHHRHIRCVDHAQLRTAGLPGHLAKGLAVFEFGQALLSQVVQVDRVEDQWHVGAVLLQQGQVIHGDVVPADEDGVKLRPALAKKCFHRIMPGQVKHLDAVSLQSLRVAAGMQTIVCEKGDRVVQVPEAAHDVGQPDAARILVRFGRGGVDHQHFAPATMVARAPDQGQVFRIRNMRRLLFQLRLPALQEGFSVDGLVSLGARGGVRAGSDAFMMNDNRLGLHQDFEAVRANPKRQVRVLIVGRRIHLVESAELTEYGRAQHDAGARAVIDFSQVLVFGLFRVIMLAVVPAVTVAENQPATLLQPAVGIDELGADQPGIGHALKGFSQPFQPALRHLGIVVEEYQESPARAFRPTVAASDEALVLFVSEVLDAMHLLHGSLSLVAGSVVHQDNLEACLAAGIEQAFKASSRVGPLVEGRYDDTDRRALPGLEAKRRLHLILARGRGGCRIARPCLDGFFGAGSRARGIRPVATLGGVGGGRCPGRGCFRLRRRLHPLKGAGKAPGGEVPDQFRQ